MRAWPFWCPRRQLTLLTCAHQPQDFVALRADTLSGKLVSAVDTWKTAPSFPIFRRVSRYFITAYEFIVPENLEIQRNLQHENFRECCL
ncbi:hypothetical protein Y032_0223g2667 [Ancylostoma ceylanicum]|uniref:Uncharacterized protein n=1 Tax=Ancylostoma ceylanicum TaxID=53326 RepID=A0A016SHG3_9BILA|nr:hypothetical protein Y032_0223g2667 [Ancylostoma ceylanicum]